MVNTSVIILSFSFLVLLIPNIETELIWSRGKRYVTNAHEADNVVVQSPEEVLTKSTESDTHSSSSLSDEKLTKTSGNNIQYTVLKTGAEVEELRKCQINFNLDKAFTKILQGTKKNLKSSCRGLASIEKDLDKYILNKLVKDRGVAQRARYAAASKGGFVPAGLNLGGETLINLDKSALFFHRIKLRNSTHFSIMKLHNDLSSMALLANISMHDLRLFGDYGRFLRNGSSNNDLFYAPTDGSADILLKGVFYNMEGRYRLAPKNRLFLELVVSNMTVTNATLVLKKANGQDGPSTSMQPYNLENLIERMKGDMDEWIQDYINDSPKHPNLDSNRLKEDQQKTLLLNNVTENVIQQLNSETGKIMELPPYKIVTVNGVVIKLTDGKLIGLDTLYRRSSATIRNKMVNVKVGFSIAKVIYNLLLKSPSETNTQNDKLFISANDIVAQMTITPRAIYFSDVRFLRKPLVSMQGKGKKESLSITTTLSITLRDLIKRKLGCLTGQHESNKNDTNTDDSGTKENTDLNDPAVLVLKEIIKSIKDFQKKTKKDVDYDEDGEDNNSKGNTDISTSDNKSQQVTVPDYPDENDADGKGVTHATGNATTSLEEIAVVES